MVKITNVEVFLHSEITWLQSKYPLIYKILASKEILLAHSVRMDNIALLIALELGLYSNDIKNISRGCLVHDIGKVYWPNMYDTKSFLNDDDKIFIRQHCELGYKLLLLNGFPEEYSRVALQHHERVDGNGYPNGLAKNEIAYYCNIAALADSYEAMTNKRGYMSSCFTPVEALKKLNEDAGHDRQLVSVLKKIIG